MAVGHSVRKGRVLLATLFAAAAALTAPAPRAEAAEPATAWDMANEVNQLRVAIGAPPITTDPRLEQSAHNHATYNVLNNTSGHYETAGNPGYTGYVAKDRAAFTGFRETPWRSRASRLRRTSCTCVR